MSAALVLFAACEPAPTPEVSFTLTNDNVEVAGLSADYLVVVDAAAKTAAIEVAYADKDQLQALQVNFVGIPSDVTVENFTFDFSTGATKEVAVSQNGATDTYVFSATCASPEPKFVTMSLVPSKKTTNDAGEEVYVAAGAEAAVAGGTAKLKGSANLSVVAFNYTVSPANTKVLVDGQEIASGAILDFSDKVNGVTFTLKCEEVEETANVKVVTTGFSSIERVWARYIKPETTDANWFGEPVAAENGSTYRYAAMDGKYVYLPKAGGPEVNVIDAMTGEFVKQLDVTGIDGGTHKTSSVQVADNNGSSVVLVANLAMNANAHLKVYAWTDLDKAPAVALDYTITEAFRFGDKFQFEGTWAEGRLIFVSYNGNADRSAAIFDVKNGVVNAEPTLVKIGTVAKSGNSICGLYKYSDTEYMWAGTGDLFATYSVSGNTFTQNYQCTDGSRFSYPMHDVHFITYNEQKYAIYCRLLNSFNDAAIRFMELNGDTLKASFEDADVTTDKQLALGDPEKEFVTALKNGNGCGTCDVYQAADGTTYVLGYAPGAGMSMFKLK